MSSEIIINDYSKYTPRRRDSLAISSIRSLLDRHHAANRDKIEETLCKFLELKSWLTQIPVHADPACATSPNWLNGWLPGADSLSLYGYTAINKPRRYIEIGSGNSTKFVRKAIEDHQLSTEIISIDPSPRAEIDSICNKVIRSPLEDMDPSYFSILEEGDLFFIDNSHRSFQNSDVTVFFTEILPRLKPGVTVGIHDIFLPFDYPNEWSDRFYNEQYLLCCYLLGGMQKLQIELPLVYLYYCTDSMQQLETLWSDERMQGVEKHGVAFWLRTI